MVWESSRSVVARRFAARSSGQLGEPFLELGEQAPAHLGLAIGQILLFHRIARKIIEFDVSAPIVCEQFPVAFAHGKARRHVHRLAGLRSEAHTSELPSLMRNSSAVFCFK